MSGGTNSMNLSTMPLIRLAVATIFVAIWAASPTQASNRLPAEVFARLPSYQQAMLSPGIKYLAYIYPIDGRKHIVIQSAGGGGKPVMIPPNKDADISWFLWANHERLLVAYEFTQFDRGLAVPYTRLVAINADGSDAKLVVKGKKSLGQVITGQIETRIVDLLYDQPDHILMALDTDRNGNYSVKKVNINTAGQSQVERAVAGSQHWLVDQQGQPRLSWGYAGSTFVMSYKKPGGGWEKLNKTQWFKNGYYPVGFDADPNIVFATGPVNGKAGLVKLDLRNGAVTQTLFSHPRVDIDTAIFDDTGRKVIGVLFTDDFEKSKYFDPIYAGLQQRIDQAAPGASNIIVESYPTRGMHLVHSSGSQSKSGYYIFESRTGRFYLVAPTGQKISDSQVASKRPVSYRARDGQLIHGYLTVPTGRTPNNLPTVVMPHGGPKFRDNQHYDYWSQFVANRGYAVFQPNFRGSTGYGYAFEKAGEKQWGGLMQDDVTDGTKWLISEGIADPKRICIVGGSYGGYSALMGAIKTPALFKCAASINGVTDMPSMITHDKKFIGGTVWTKDWALEGEKIRAVSPYHQRDAIQIPILLVADRQDSRVPYRQSKSLSRALKADGKPVTYIETDGGGHSLDHEQARLAMLKGLETFLDQNIGR